MEFGKKQKKIINNKPNGHLLIKGPKGSGKTTAFIHKIPSLLNNYCISKDDKILVAACNEEYSDYFILSIEILKVKNIIKIASLMKIIVIN